MILPNLNFPNELNRLQKWLLSVSLLYALIMTAAFLISGNPVIVQVNIYVSAICAAWAAVYLFTLAIRQQNESELLFAALGMSCLTLGNLYFVLLDVVDFQYDVISVGLFAKVCFYLFFIAILSTTKTQKMRQRATVSLGSFAVAASCAYAVITNSYLVINVSVMLLNLLIIILAIGQLRMSPPRRLFAQVMLFLAFKNILSVFSVLALPTDSLSPALYILIVVAVLWICSESESSLAKETQHAF